MFAKFTLIFLSVIFSAGACEFIHPTNLKGKMDGIFESGVTYSMLGPFISKRKNSHIMLYVGNAKGIKGGEFRERLTQHVNAVTEAMKSKGKVGYLIYATDDQELALVQYESEAAMKKAFEQNKDLLGAESQFVERKIWEKFNPAHFPITEDWVKHQFKRARDEVAQK